MPATISRPSPASGAPAPRLGPSLERAAEELNRLSEVGRDVELLLCSLLGAARAERPQDVQLVQEVDRLLQHLDGVAAFLRGLAEAEREGRAPESAVDVLRNGSLISALLGESVGRPSAGDPELF